jgi:hypothetical protein
VNPPAIGPGFAMQPSAFPDSSEMLAMACTKDDMGNRLNAFKSAPAIVFLRARTLDFQRLSPIGWLP